jgi:anti-sigma factor RsiW
MSHDDDDARKGATTHVDCRNLVDLLGDYVDDQLTQEQRAAVDGHMEQCAPCMAFLKQYRFAPQAVRAHLLQKVPVDLETRLLSFLKTKTQCNK